MARYDGQVDIDSNYEPTIAGPMDARLSVEHYTDLFDSEVFDTKWVWQGMQVAVTDDEVYKGVYELIDVEKINTSDGWSRILTLKDAGEEGISGPTGASAYEIALEQGYVGTEAEWIDSLHGKSAYEIAVAEGYEGTEEEWLKSINGKSAYELAVEEGYEGTEEEWIESLHGKDGVGIVSITIEEVTD